MKTITDLFELIREDLFERSYMCCLGHGLRSCLDCEEYDYCWVDLMCESSGKMLESGEYH